MYDIAYDINIIMTTDMYSKTRQIIEPCLQIILALLQKSMLYIFQNKNANAKNGIRDIKQNMRRNLMCVCTFGLLQNMFWETVIDLVFVLKFASNIMMNVFILCHASCARTASNGLCMFLFSVILRTLYLFYVFDLPFDIMGDGLRYKNCCRLK